VASSDGRSLGFAVAGLIVFGGMIAWMLAGPSRESAEPTEAEEFELNEPAVAAELTAAKAPAAEDDPAPQPVKPAPAAPDPDVDLFAGAAPDFITDAHARVLGKKWLDVGMQKQLYNFGQEHKDDARPQLLLAWDSMNREWYGIAVRMYRIAYRADRRAKHDPTMLRDLLFIAGRYDKTEFREATEIINEAYGEEALPRIDEEIAAARGQHELTRTERLERLRAAVAGR
jgi:hypothetical protein